MDKIDSLHGKFVVLGVKMSDTHTHTHTEGRLESKRKKGERECVKVSHKNTQASKHCFLNDLHCSRASPEIF